MNHLLAKLDALTARMSWQEVVLGSLALGGIVLVALVAYLAYAIWHVNDQIHAEDR